MHTRDSGNTNQLCPKKKGQKVKKLDILTCCLTLFSLEIFECLGRMGRLNRDHFVKCKLQTTILNLTKIAENS